MIEIRRSQERHHQDFGWLDTKWSFSFDSYYDPAQTSFGPLRVFNDDVIQPGTGFPMHPHRDMEILTFVLAGAVQHQDSLGTSTIIRAGEIQRMTAGTGIRHSEANPSPTEPLHLLQVWIMPEREGLPPSYEQRAFATAHMDGRLLPVVAGTAEGEALRIHQDVTVYRAHMQATFSVTHKFAKDRRGYLFLISGSARVNGSPLGSGDAAKITEQPDIHVIAESTAELLLFDLP